MRILITGMNGTVAPVVARQLENLGHEAISWDRSTMPYEGLDAVTDTISRTRVSAVLHFATGPVEWAENIAQVCLARKLGMLHASSVSVFGAHQFGPLSPTSVPEPDDDYGRYKRDGERRVMVANPQALVARIGWQIGDAPGSNNMVDYFHRRFAEHGVIQVSRNWIPSCALLGDTAKCLCALFSQGTNGLVHCEGNPGRSLFDLAQWTASRIGLPGPIEPEEEPARQNLMVDNRVEMAKLDF